MARREIPKVLGLLSESVAALRVARIDAEDVAGLHCSGGGVLHVKCCTVVARMFYGLGR